MVAARGTLGPFMPFRDPRTGAVYYNLTEIARRWGQSVATVLRYHVQPKLLPTIPAGRARWVSARDLAAYERKLRVLVEAKIAKYNRFLERLDAPLGDEAPPRPAGARAGARRPRR